jgi:N-acetylglutamate synthase-like GNAT family acetyltransferase
MTPLEIVPFAPQHAAGVVDVILPIQQREFGIPISLDDQPDLRDVPGFYRRGAGNFWVAVADGRVVGTIALLDVGDGQGALRKMFVERAYRGAEHGVAARLLDVLVAWCHERGVRVVFLGTTEHFHAAHRFYEKHGFHEIDRDALPATFPVMRVDTKFYRRTLCIDPALPSFEKGSS